MKLRCSDPNRGTMLGWLGAIMMFLGAANVSRAADRVWTNAPAGPLDYNAASSWTNGVAPGASDAAVFTNAAAAQPDLSASIANQQVRFAGAAASGYTLSANPGASLTLTNTGSGATAGTGAALVGQHTSGTNIISAPIILGAAAGSTQYVNMAGAGTFVLSGGISEQNSGIKLQLDLAASSVLRLSGNNTFTGGLTYNTSGSSSVLELGSDTAIPASGTFTLSSTQARTIRLSGATRRTVANPFAINTAGALTFGRDPGFSGGATVFTGATTLETNTVVFAGTGDAVVFEGSIGETGGSRNFTQNSGGGINSVQGYLFLMATNAWTGATTLNLAASENRGATFTVAKYLANANTADSLGANTGANTTVAARSGNSAGTIIRYIGGPSSSDRTWNWGDSASSSPLPMVFDASGSGALTLNGTLNPLGLTGTKRTATLTFDGANTASNTFAGIIANPTATADSSTAIAKSGLGTWLLSGANTFTNGITVSSGKFVLDYVSNGTVVNSANAVALAGGTLEFKANPTVATAQALGNLPLSYPAGATSRLLFSRPGAGSLAVTFGTVSRSSSSGDGRNALYVDNAAGATVAGSATLVNSILAWAVIKDSTDTGFLTTSGANLVRYTAAATLGASSNSATTNYKLSGDLALTSGSKKYNSLAVDTTGGGTLTIASGSRITPGALLFTGDSDFTLTGGTNSPGVEFQAGDRYIHQYSDGVVTIASVFANPLNTAADSGNLTKTGPGSLVLSGQMVASGSIVIMEGALRADHASVLTTFAAGRYITLGGGGVLELGAAGNFTNAVGTAAGNVRWYGDGGFSAYGATRTVQLNGGTASLTWGSANFVPANNALVLGGRDANAMIDFQNGLDFGFQQRVVRVMNGSAAVDARLSGALAGNYGGGLIKDGAGTLELTAANSYLGETWVREGTLRVSGSTGSGAMTVYNGGSISGTGTVARLTLNSGGALKPYDTGGDVPSRLIVTGTLNITAGTLDLSGLGTVASGDHIVAECGSMVGSQFSNVIGLPSGRTIKYGATAITLKSGASGTLVMIQ